MNDPTDASVHGGKPATGPTSPPARRKGKEARPGEADLADPNPQDPTAPHDRRVEKDGGYMGAGDDMLSRTKSDHAACRKGKTQNSPDR
jgi:hypothetical protein